MQASLPPASSRRALLQCAPPLNTVPYRRRL